MDHGNARVQGLAGGGELDGLSVQEDFARIGNVDAEEAFHEGGFAGPVLPHEGVDSAWLDPQTHIVQGLDPRKAFGYMVHLQNISGVAHGSLPLYLRIKNGARF